MRNPERITSSRFVRELVLEYAAKVCLKIAFCKILSEFAGMNFQTRSETAHGHPKEKSWVQRYQTEI